ncbi:polysaccharide pyruvyl transferase family protein [Brevibacterium oceani]|uniref:polysaccharide pyruvyl transferase family protein n=1 Tax=Brevibacterium oceani TaxID=358099 RepID=UPI001B33F6D5|nr:polysaccharide pyruvyl transferase family protein [Brevibacterium oceani]
MNAFHNNTGNVAFPYGIFRNLSGEQTQVESDWYGARLPDADAVNENYSMYILPMANDMGAHFAGEMRRLTSFIKQLEIPVVVIGIGGAFSIDEKFDSSFTFDRTVKDFIKAVLDRSASVGLRGEISGRYLKHLGFQEGRHFEVIGDPTLYDLGPELSIRDVPDLTDAKITYNMTPKAPQSALQFLTKIAATYTSSVYIPQDIGEFCKYYYGTIDPNANMARETVPNFPKTLTDTPYATGRIKFFFDFISWVNYMAEQDFSIGTRIHGNIIPTYAGIPSLTLAYGSRLKELAEYHNLPHLDASAINPDADLSDLVSKFDFNSPKNVHESNFEHFTSFLDKNGLKHHYKDTERSHLPFDNATNGIKQQNLIPITAVTDPDQIQARVAEGFEILQHKIVSQKTRLDRLKNEVIERRAEMKSVQSIVKTW